MVRYLKPSDVPAAVELSQAAGWNQTAEDWHRAITLEPEGAFGIERDGKLVATTTLLCFGTDLAWIGMVLTHRDYQRMGLARRLVAAAIDTARGRGVRTVKLDATDQGHDLYASLGFADEQPIERWRREPQPYQPAEGRTGAIPFELDAEAFGADRSRLLKALPAPALVEENGYILTRPGVRAQYAGPCVARDRQTAARLISAAIDDGAWFLDLLPSNNAAPLIATQFGFVPVRHLTRMALGTPLRGRDSEIYAIACFKAG